MKKLLALSALLALTSSTLAFAQIEHKQPVPQKKMHGVHQQAFQQELEQKLNLTEEQKEEIKLLKEKQKEEIKPIFEQLKQKEEETSNLRQQLKALKAQHKKDFEAILTDKQLEKLNEIKAEHKKNFEKNIKKHHKKYQHKK